MLIHFENIEETSVPHARGGEKQFDRKHVDTGDNQIMLGRLVPGASIGVHTHTDASETIYFLSGTGKMTFDGRIETITPGVCHHCPKGHSHSLENNGDEDLTFFAVIPKQ